MSDGRKNNRPVRPMPRALSDEAVAAVDYMVHELGARQWKVGMKLGVSCVTIGNAINRRGAYAMAPRYVGNAELCGGTSATNAVLNGKTLKG